MHAVAEAAMERHGRLDVLCANAGIYPQTKLEEMSSEEWDQVMATNLKGNFLSIKACLPHLKNSDYGRIVLTSSITGPVTGFPGWTHYGASKSGQLGFMRTACMEFAKYGITVNAVLPGNTLTEGLMALGEDYLKTMAASVPLNRLGTVEDIGNAALFLATREAGYITGQTIIVDGGQIIPSRWRRCRKREPYRSERPDETNRGDCNKWLIRQTAAAMTCWSGPWTGRSPMSWTCTTSRPGRPYRS